jgi:hypothetical protein
MKIFKITDEQREQIIYFLNHHSIYAAKQMLNQLEEIKEEKEEKEGGENNN